MENNSNKDHEIELLKLEYQQCQSGYNSRDGLAEDEFCKVIQKFSVFLTILLAFNIFIEISPAFHFLVCVIIGVAGLCCLFSLLIVIESNSGCNVALRKRCRQIEDRLKELTGFQIQYWQAIEDRPKRPEENIVKGIWGKKADREKKEQERNIFVYTVWLLIVLWIIIVGAMIMLGDRISLKDLGGKKSSASAPQAKVISHIDHRPVSTGYYCPAGLSSQAEKQEYKQDMARIKALRKSFKPGLVNDLEQYEKFADEIQERWQYRNKEHYARLMLEVCGPLSSGTFADDRRHDVARRYALSVLEKSEEISIEMELQLTGHVMTSMYTRNAPKGEDLAQRRKKDVQIRLHAWKRLLGAIDPNWDPNEVLLSPNAIGVNMGLPAGGIAPESIKDPKLRAEYEAALERNRQKGQRYSEQSRLRDWLKKFPRRAERYIVKAYSEPPFRLEELKQYLDNYIADEKTKARIVSAVKKNMEKQI